MGDFTGVILLYPVKREGEGYFLGHKMISQQGISPVLKKRTVYHLKAQDSGIEVITGGDLVSSPLGQKAYVWEESAD